MSESRSRIACVYGVAHAWADGGAGQPAVPRGDDVRRLGQPRPRRVGRGSSTAALDAGINFIDTADVYSQGESEEIVGKALAGGGATTSCSRPSSTGRWATTPNRRGNSRRWIIQAVEDSLRRLGTDWIDLYQMHRPDPDNRHRRDARRAERPRPRRARSATSAARPSRRTQIVEAQWVAERRGRERFVCEQPPYSILVRGIEARRAARLPAATAWA